MSEQDEVVQAVETAQEEAKSKKGRMKSVVPEDPKEPEFVKALKREPQITVRIPVSELNPKDDYVPVSINGYIYQVKRGETVTLPETVVKLLEKAKYI